MADDGGKPLNGAAGELTMVKLQKAVVANGEPVTELTFREPTGHDIERYGNPINFNGERFVYDEKKMTMMLAMLASVPPSTIRAMHPGDWNTAAWKVAGFFIPDVTQLLPPSETPNS